MSSINALWSASSIAVIGASERPGALGRLPIAYLKKYGYEGRILPINPKADQIQGIPAYPRVQDAGGPVDLALVMVSADRVPAAIDDCVEAGVPMAVIASSGFAETGPAGAALQADVVAKARAGGLRFIGPNCIGSVAFGNRVMATFSPLFSAESVPFEPGRLAFVSQSGALGFGAASLAMERGIRPGWVVSTGNDADVTVLEVLAELAEEPDCDGLLAYLEDVPDIEALRRIAASGKPVALLKSGRSPAGERAAASHTGALATDDRVVDAALRQLGIARAGDVDELLDFADAFSSPRRPRGPRVAIVTTSGGSGILGADAVATSDLELSPLKPETRDLLGEIVPAFGAIDNPVDITATVLSDPSLFDRSLGALAADDTVDSILACFCVMAGPDVDKAVTSLSRVAAESGKPVLVAKTGADFLAPDAPAKLRAAGLPTYASPGRAVQAISALYQVSRSRVAGFGGDEGPALPAPPPGATEPELKALLREAGLAVPRGGMAAGPDDAVALVRELGGSAVLKAVVPGVVHKTELGGVRVGVAAADAATVWEELAALGGRVYVEELVAEGTDMLVGVRSSELGPVLTVGLGGVLAEALDDVSCRLLPLGPGEAAEMLADLRGAALLAGWRGAPAADAPALVGLLETIGRLTAGWPAGFELDLNPVRVLTSGVCVLDASYVAPEHTAEPAGVAR